MGIIRKTVLVHSNGSHKIVMPNAFFHPGQAQGIPERATCPLKHHPTRTGHADPWKQGSDEDEAGEASWCQTFGDKPSGAQPEGAPHLPPQDQALLANNHLVLDNL